MGILIDGELYQSGQVRAGLHETRSELKPV